MIIGNLDNITELMPYVSLRLGAALAFLRDTDFKTLESGQYDVMGSEVFAKVESYETLESKAKKMEAHRNYIDVQFIADGKESIGVASLTEDDEIIENISENDLYFYGEPENKEQKIQLQKGDFLIIFPWELHRPGCNFDEKKINVKKVVVKVKIGG